MVKDRKSLIDTLTLKITNLLKHLPCRGLKLIALDIRQLAEPVASEILTIVIATPEGPSKSLFLTLNVPRDEAAIKKTITEVLKSIPKQYLQITVVNVRSALKSVKSSLDIEALPDSFQLIKLPYRQLSISLNDKTTFIDLCTASYQRILANLNSLKGWPDEIDLELISNCMKRKELLVLVWTLNSFL